jgi:flagellar biosynthesis/type III secretory pathway chaperone
MTQGINAAQSRDVVRRILQDEIALLKQLAGLLQNEHGFIAGNDLDGLERASATRQDCVAQLLKLGDERRDLCQMLGKGADLAGLSALLAWCDPEGSLAALMTEHAERSGACREQNERNGALVGARMSRVSQMLGMMAGNAAPPTVYGRAGLRAPTVPANGRLVAARA